MRLQEDYDQLKFKLESEKEQDLRELRVYYDNKMSQMNSEYKESRSYLMEKIDCLQ